MAITFAEERAVLSEMCAVEEAEPFFEWLRTHPEGVVDLSACEHLHAAVYQTLLALKPNIAALPAEPFLQQWLFSGWSVTAAAEPVHAEAVPVPEDEEGVAVPPAGSATAPRKSKAVGGGTTTRRRKSAAATPVAALLAATGQEELILPAAATEASPPDTAVAD
ncbi:MAG: hypothetical protein HQM04_04225 [Magnetococcales bacterium]|nr:hypothetical protein [Magnetococcales bacterium]MBF0114230.1 hypothetical protein [Magnetococcales bacterium]